MLAATWFFDKIPPNGGFVLPVCNQLRYKIIIMQSNMQIKLQIVLKIV